MVNMMLMLGMLQSACTATEPTPAKSVTVKPKPQVRESIRNMTRASLDRVEAEFLNALKEPLIKGMNVKAALQAWFDGREKYCKNDKAGANAIWRKGMLTLKNLVALPVAEWGAMPTGNLKILRSFSVRDATSANFFVVGWEVDKLQQYGVLVVPKFGPAGKPLKLDKVELPLLLYLHGAAFGVPLHALPWLAQMAAKGYAVIGPALRGENLFSSASAQESFKYRCEGKIENLDGEVDDALAAVVGAQKLPFVKPGRFAIVAHSFGAGVGLLVAARSPDTACVVSYDAWLTNPFRYYWDRMRRSANNWGSWEEFCDQPVEFQLAELMKRSVVHHAAKINCPLLMFIGGRYNGSVFHKSHDDFTAELKRHKKEYEYEIVPDGGHNFVLYYDSKPAKYALQKHMKFLQEKFPPLSVRKSK